MSAVLKAGSSLGAPLAPTVFHLRDLMGETDVLVARAREEARQVVAAAKAEADRHREHARREGFEQGRREGHAEGREQGLSEARASAQQLFERDLRHLAQTLSGAAQCINDERQERLHAAERDVLDFALAVARRVALTAGAAGGEAARENLRRALALVISRSEVEVRAHPDDMAALRDFAGELADTLTGLDHLSFVEDPAVTRGGVRVINAAGEIDATIEQQLDQIARALGARPMEQDPDV